LSSIPDVVFDPDRLAALDGYAILDTVPEAGFDDIVQLAMLICETPVALVSLVAEDRQWFKAHAGFEPCETDLDSSVCAHALAEANPLIIPDLTADPRTVANPLVTGEPFIRFYACPFRLPRLRCSGPFRRARKNIDPDPWGYRYQIYDEGCKPRISPFHSAAAMATAAECRWFRGFSSNRQVYQDQSRRPRIK
jgi:hypothetical protein